MKLATSTPTVLSRVALTGVLLVSVPATGRAQEARTAQVDSIFATFAVSGSPGCAVPAGGITGFTLDAGRVRGIRFDRVK